MNDPLAATVVPMEGGEANRLVAAVPVIVPLKVCVPAKVCDVSMRATLAEVDGNVIVVPSVPASVREFDSVSALLLTVKTPVTEGFARVAVFSVGEVASTTLPDPVDAVKVGFAIVAVFNVAEVIVGEVASTTFPEPVEVENVGVVAVAPVPVEVMNIGVVVELPARKFVTPTAD